MKIIETNKIIATLPKERTLFYYFKDRYAFMLLGLLVGEGVKIRDIKEGDFARLLNRPQVKDFLSKSGDGHLTKDALEAAWPEDFLVYRLTLGKWGSDKGDRFWDQTTRRKSNLVLHLNFSNKHDKNYLRFVDREKQHPFIYGGHPNAREGFYTMAWARLDLDFETGEVLIEELQTDWLRRVRWVQKYIKNHPDLSCYDNQRVNLYDLRCSWGELKTYINQIIAPHMALWDEAMLSAAIWFLREELKFKVIYLHEADCGVRLKNIVGTPPPRSLYTQLPKKFCFKLVNHGPAFMEQFKEAPYQTLKRAGKLRFWKLELPE